MRPQDLTHTFAISRSAGSPAPNAIHAPTLQLQGRPHLKLTMLLPGAG